MKTNYILLSLIFTFSFCNSSDISFDQSHPKSSYDNVIPGAERLRKYIPTLTGKNIAVVVNQTSLVEGRHLIDTLINFDLTVKTIFAPEHGFRGEADAGAHIKDGMDMKTNIPIRSLYGKHKKPSSEDLKGIDYVLFDIQDVGVRFYTYISTLTYVMEACAQNDIPLIVLDRPNPNGYLVDGPVLKEGYESFVGLHHIPVIYGMTIGEYAMMVNGEKWMEDGVTCELSVIPCTGYTHEWVGELPVRPSPNLPNIESILLYPSLCFFEGTIVSVGRGTSAPFQQIGHPDYPMKDYSFIPQSSVGAKNPKLKNQRCYGLNLEPLNIDYIKSKRELDLSYILNFYKNLDKGKDFFLSNNFIDKLSGSDELRKQIQAGYTADQIKATWQEDIESFKLIRSKYLLYP